MFWRRKAVLDLPIHTPSDEGRFGLMGREERAEYDAYVASLPSGCPIIWACTFDGIPRGPGSRWAGKPRRMQWQAWADEILDG